MSLRGVWIFSALGNDTTERVLFSRRFATVERRAVLLQGGNLTPIPNDWDLCDAILREVGSRREAGPVLVEFDGELDSCSKVEHKPAHEVQLKEGSLWPVVVIEKFGLVFACVPCVEMDITHGKPPLVKLPGVSLGYCLLHCMVNFVSSWTSKEQLQSRMKELYRFLSVAAPFGSPVDMNPSTVQSLLNSKDIIVPQKGKQPAWKPVQYKGKQQLVFNVKEEIRAVQYNKKDLQDEWQLFGIITCRADLEGIPEITANVTSSSLDFLVVHPCVLEGDTHVQTPSFQPSQMLSPGAELVGRKLRFRPPTESFPLCHYSAKATQGLPIRGIYQMQGDGNSVQVSVQLKMNNKVKNSFEYCEVHLPFFYRGPIVRVDSAGPSTGNILFSPDKRRLVWNIGQKFPSKTLEASLNATVYFGEKQQQTPSNQQVPGFVEDPFCTGINSYAQVLFKIQEFTLSGCAVDQKSLVVYPGAKFKLNITYEFMSADYKIWNTHGDALAAFPPPAMDSTE